MPLEGQGETYTILRIDNAFNLSSIALRKQDFICFNVEKLRSDSNDAIGITNNNLNNLITSLNISFVLFDVI